MSLYNWSFFHPLQPTSTYSLIRRYWVLLFLVLWPIPLSICKFFFVRTGIEVETWFSFWFICRISYNDQDKEKKSCYIFSPVIQFGFSLLRITSASYQEGCSVWKISVNVCFFNNKIGGQLKDMLIEIILQGFNRNPLEFE